MEVYGLVGNPVGHSLSPSMHEAAYAELDLDARYVTFEPDPDELAAAVEGASALGVAGLNVTVPFKDDVLAHAAPTDLAARVGAVNTLDFGSDPPTGYNTDVAGVRRAFAHENVALSGRAALVVGAGGAGRAAAFALADADATVHVANRTVARAEALAADLPHATAHGLDALADLVPEAEVLVNATTVGMETDESPVPADLLHDDLAVLDAVYRPRETRLLRYAAAAGATTVDGSRMLLYQGAEAFEIWTGETAPIEAMERGLESALDDG